MPPRDRSLLVGLTIAFWAAVVWSAYAPFNAKDYWIEIATPALGFLLLLASAPRFRFSSLAYVVMFLEALVLIVGAHYTHERVPLFDWIRDLRGGTRNDYDRLAHFCVGFLLFVPVREVLRRSTPLRGAWLEALSVVVLLAWGAFYEITEWWIAVLASPDAATAYLGSQGDPWDAQKDMLLDGVGALAALPAFARWHERQLEAFNRR